MITTGIVKNILTDINNTTIYKLEIPIFRNPGFASDPYLYEATSSVNPGTYNPYSVDDLVYVGFVDNRFDQPVILGKIYKNLPSEDETSATYQFLNTIRVTDKAELPLDTIIGDISYKEIVENLKAFEILSDDLIILSQGGKDKWLHTNEITGALEWSNLPYPAVSYLKSARIEDGSLIIVDQNDNEIVYNGGGVQDVITPNGTSIVDNSIAELPDYGISYISEEEPDTNLIRTWLTDSFEDFPNDTYDSSIYYAKDDTVIYHNKTYISLRPSNHNNTPGESGSEDWWELLEEHTLNLANNVSPLNTNSLEGLDTRGIIFDGINDIPQETNFEDIEDQVGGLDTSGKVYN